MEITSGEYQWRSLEEITGGDYWRIPVEITGEYQWRLLVEITSGDYWRIPVEITSGDY